MPVLRSGITTGLLGYTLRKEFLGDILFYRETEVFNFEIYSINVSGSTFTPNVLHQNIISEFANKYSGDINAKVFQVPGDYTFPNDSIRASKFNVQIEIKRNPSGLADNQTELSSNYYRGLDSNFFANHGNVLSDFREDFGFEQGENGNQTFSHNVSFAISSGTSNSRNKAVEIASGLFGNDKDTTFGISTMVGNVVIGNTGIYQNYFTETYDLIRNTFNFNKRREILAISGLSYTYNLIHGLDLRDDGVFDISEKANVKGFLSFGQAKQGADDLLTGAYNRCNAFYNTYKDFAGGTGISDPLITAATRTAKSYNRPALAAEYEVNYTNNPSLGNNGVNTEEIIELEADEKNLVEIKHRYNFLVNKRNPPSGSMIGLLNNAYSVSPGIASGYYLASNFYNSSFAIHQTKYDLTWPSNKSRCTANFQYSNNPRNFVTLNGLSFYSFDYKVQNVKPVDIVTEYKVVNRANNLSVLNYAYQTEKGQLSVTIDAGLGKDPNEFVSGFRSNISNYLVELYKFGIGLFMKQFVNTIPISFTYQLSDIRYSVNSDGMVQMNLVFVYTLKKYTA